MEKVIIGFSRPKSWKPLAWLIMLALGTPYSHVFIKTHSESLERDLIYQASGLAVNFMSPSIFTDHNLIVQEFSFDILSQDRKELLKFCIDNCGKPYGIKALAGLMWVYLNDSILKRKVSNPFRDGRNSYVCCELAALVARDFLKVRVEQDLDDVNPKELHEALEQSA